MNFIHKKLQHEVPPEGKDDEVVKQHKKNEIARELVQHSETQMKQLEMWLDSLKLKQKDWREIFDAVS